MCVMSLSSGGEAFQSPATLAAAVRRPAVCARSSVVSLGMSGRMGSSGVDDLRAKVTRTQIFIISL
jgi:hypothetical protein